MMETAGGKDMEVGGLLRLMADKGASDLFLSAGAPVNIKIDGETRPLKMPSLSADDIRAMAYSLITEDQQKQFEAELELNFAVGLPDAGRFRINLYRQRGAISMVIRFINSNIPSIESLNLPPILKELIMKNRGLILVVGATGSGKSTTLASMIDYRNQHRYGHILTIEEPIEFYHEHGKSVVDQREVGFDTLNYANALKNAMREAPDVILIGEIPDRETMQQAIAYAETGHLCLSTLHANNANQTIDRIINFFPDSAHQQLKLDLSLNLIAVISQRLIPGQGGKRVPAVEIMLRSAYIADLIEKGEIYRLKEVMEKGNEVGMKTFDQALYELYESGRISVEEALYHADSRNNLSLRIRLESGRGEEHASHDGLSLK